MTQYISISEIYSKIKNKSDIINYFREQGLYFPDLPCYNNRFFLEVLQGKKKLLNLGCIGGFNVPYYTREKLLTKEHIFSKFVNDEELLQYIPSDAKLSSLTRELLLSILAYIKKEKYLELYGIYKTIKLQRSTTGCKSYDIKIQTNFIEKIQEYVSVAGNEKSQIRLHQNGRLLNGIRNADEIKRNKNTQNIGNISDTQMNLNMTKQINLIPAKKEAKKNSDIFLQKNSKPKNADIEMKDDSKNIKMNFQ